LLYADAGVLFVREHGAYQPPTIPPAGGEEEQIESKVFPSDLKRQPFGWKLLV